ncbi:MAG TPA: YoaK family protein [Polyangiaceae bacterium]
MQTYKTAPNTEPMGSANITVGVLSAVAGYVDTAGFLALFGLLPSHVTADLVTAAAGASLRPQGGLISRVLMIPLFLLAVVGSTVVARALRRRGVNTLTPLLAFMTLALAVFCGGGVLLDRFVDGSENWAVFLSGGSAIVAMAIQNTIMRVALKHVCPTTVMTGNLTQVTVDMVEYLLLTLESKRDANQEARRQIGDRIVKFGVPVAAFMIGAVSSAYLTRHFGLMSIVLPTCVVAVLTLTSWRTARSVAPRTTLAVSDVRLPTRRWVRRQSEPVELLSPAHSGTYRVRGLPSVRACASTNRSMSTRSRQSGK